MSLMRSMKLAILSGWGYYHTSNAMHDTNTAYKTGVYSMQDSNMVSYVVPHFLIALQISMIVIMKHKYHKYQQ